MSIPPNAYPVPITTKQIETAMQLLTIQMLGLPAPSVPTDPSYAKVRVGWQRLGQPMATIDEDVTFLRCVEVDDPYNRTRDVENIVNDSVSVGQLTTYIRIWECFWQIYGPNSVDNGRLLRTNLFTQQVHDTFAVYGLALALVTDIAAPQHMPLETDGQWWDIVNFSARFNELVSEVVIVPTVASSEIVVETSDRGVVIDITVTAP